MTWSSKRESWGSGGATTPPATNVAGRYATSVAVRQALFFRHSCLVDQRPHGHELGCDGGSVADHDDDQAARLEVLARYSMDVRGDDVADALHEVCAVLGIDAIEVGEDT